MNGVREMLKEIDLEKDFRQLEVGRKFAEDGFKYSILARYWKDVTKLIKFVDSNPASNSSLTTLRSDERELDRNYGVLSFRDSKTRDAMFRKIGEQQVLKITFE